MGIVERDFLGLLGASVKRFPRVRIHAAVPVPYPKGIWHSGTVSGFRVPESVMTHLARCNESLANIGESGFGNLARLAFISSKLVATSRKSLKREFFPPIPTPCGV